MNGMSQSFHDGKRSAVCKNAKVQEKFFENFCFINKNFNFLLTFYFFAHIMSHIESAGA